MPRKEAAPLFSLGEPKGCMTIRGKFLGVAMGVWGVLVAGGFYGLLRHATQPGLAAAAGGSWPAQAAVEPAAGKLTVVMAVHPGCPCSEASMANLGEVLARHPGAAVCYVLFEPDKAISPEEERAVEAGERHQGNGSDRGCGARGDGGVRGAHIRAGAGV